MRCCSAGARLPRRCSCCCRWSRCSSRRSQGGVGAYLDSVIEPDALAGDQADPARRGDRGSAQHRLRPRRGLGDHQVRLSAARASSSPYRPALLGLAGRVGPDLRAAVRRAGLVRRRGLQAHDIADHLRGARHRPGDDLRHLPLRRARAHPADGRAGPRRRGGGAVAGRERLADLLARHPAQHPLGAALRRAAVQCPGDGRVRRGVGRLRPYPRRDQHHAAACRDTLQRI